MITANNIKNIVLLVSVWSLVACSTNSRVVNNTNNATKTSASPERSAEELKVIESERLDRAQALQALHTAKNLPPIVAPIYNKKATPMTNAWDRVRKNFKLDLSINNRRTRVQRNWYKRHQDYINRVSKRAEPYLYHVINEVEKRNLPGELALLPIVESAFDPFAYSHGRASGMWQFIPGTGKRYGLKQDWWYDGRRDVVASTRAALDYLEALNKRFKGNWLHALAAYNAGEGNVSKAIRYNKKRGRPTDFWSLNLPKETKAYVPKLLAISQLLDTPAKYNLQFPELPNSPQFAQVDVGSQIDLAQAAELADITLDELYLLNPGYNQWATSPDGPHTLNVPIQKAIAFKTNLAQLPKEKRISWIRYKIRNGDSLSTIARKHRTTAKALKQVNNLRTSRIRAGNVLFIPVASKASQHYALSSAQRLLVKQRSGAKAGKQKNIHVVKPGDSFWTISRKHKVGMRELARWNGLGTTSKLRIGQKLVVWAPAKNASARASTSSRQLIRKINYRVRSGDSLARVAQKFNVSIRNIESWNGINRKKYLQPGQSLKLYVDITRASL